MKRTMIDYCCVHYYMRRLFLYENEENFVFKWLIKTTVGNMRMPHW